MGDSDGKVSADMVLKWAKRHRVCLDERIARDMIHEADYKNEGEIAIQHIWAAVSGMCVKIFWNFLFLMRYFVATSRTSSPADNDKETKWRVSLMFLWWRA